MQGKKTHEQQLRILERKDDLRDARTPTAPQDVAHVADPEKARKRIRCESQRGQ